MFGISVQHISPFSEAYFTDFAAAFRQPLSRQSMHAMASDLRLDMRGTGRIFSPKSSLVFEPLHSVEGFSYAMSPQESVELCKRNFRISVNETFDLITSNEPLMFLMCLSRDSRPQKVYSHVVSNLLAINPRAKRNFYLLSPSEFHAGIARQSHGFYTLSFPIVQPGEQGVIMAAPYVKQAITHFLLQTT
jgi:hypothetical protein